MNDHTPKNRVQALIDQFETEWRSAEEDHNDKWLVDGNWRRSMRTFASRGLAPNDITTAVDATYDASLVDPADNWKYFCGVCWGIIRNREDGELVRV